jgi:pilus assembly protein CpaB
VLFGALAVAVLATYGAYHMIDSARDQSRVPTRNVVVASRDLPEGVGIDRIALTTRAYPVAAVPESAFNSVDSVVGRITRVPVFAGEAIVVGRLAPIGVGPGLETKIAPGTRAMAVKINDVAGISGLLQPNSRVDVLVTLPEGSDRESQMAKIFMENMRVLSVGTEVQRDNDGKPINATTVTLGVTPQEAERLAVAMNRGSIQLVMRGYGDPDTVRTAGATSHDVLAQLRGAPIAPAQPQSTPTRHVARAARPTAPVQVAAAPPLPDSVRVEVYRGDKSTRQSFEKSAALSGSRTP